MYFFLQELSADEAEVLKDHCFLLTEDITDWIVRSPVLFVLTVNILFLIRIMWVSKIIEQMSNL